MTSDAILRLLTRRERAFGQHDAAALAADYAEDCLVESPTEGTLRGRDAILKAYQKWFKAFRDFAWQTEDRLLCGDRVVQVATITGTDDGGFLDQAATGKSFRLTAVLILTFRDGQIVNERRVIDRGGLLLQLAEGHDALKTGELYRDVLARTRQAHDLRVAAEVQQALAPPSQYVSNGVSLASRLVACRAIGGDFLDYFELPNRHVGVVLGDVAGKGPAAALLAALLQGVFASHIQLGGEPAELLTMVHKVMLRRQIDARYATCVYSVLSPSGELTYCTAANERPLLISGHGLHRLEEANPPLGLFPEATTFKAETLHLEPGDLLIVFSDGVTEAEDKAGNFFGTERVAGCLAACHGQKPAEVLDQLFVTINQFRSGADQSDDMSALAIQYDPT